MSMESSIALSEDESGLASQGGEVVIWDSDSGERSQTFAIPGEELVDLFDGVGIVAWAPDGYTLAVAVDNSLVIWEAQPSP